MKNYLKWSALLLMILLVLTMEATFAVNETGSNAKINFTKSTNVTNATTNIATMRDLATTPKLSKINNLTISINLSRLENVIGGNKVTDAVTMPINPIDEITAKTISQNSDDSGGGCPCHSQG